MDSTLLRILKYRTEFKKLYPVLNQETLQSITQRVLSSYAEFFTTFKDKALVDYETYSGWFSQRYPKLDSADKATILAIVSNTQQDADAETYNGFTHTLYELNYATKLANDLRAYSEGGEVDILSTVQTLTNQFKIDVRSSDDITAFVDDDITDILKEEERDDGLRFRLEPLRRCMRPLRSGDFGILAGRPDKGKTSFLACEATYWAEQLNDAESTRPILWLNNEGPGRRIIPRLYQAALGIDGKEMVEMHATGKLIPAYEKLIGHQHRIKIIDIHGYNTSQVERAIEHFNPAIIIYDMIDNIRGFNNEARGDLRLEEMYKWAREICVLHDTIGIATSQISAEGDGLLYPTMPMLKDSKTGKQGACDFQIMLGSSNDTNLINLRGIGIVKNKLQRVGFPSNPMEEVTFNPYISRYEEIKS